MLRDYSSAGEHFVDIEGVTGSIPVGFSHKFQMFISNYYLYFSLLSLNCHKMRDIWLQYVKEIISIKFKSE